MTLRTVTDTSTCPPPPQKVRNLCLSTDLRQSGSISPAVLLFRGSPHAACPTTHRPPPYIPQLRSRLPSFNCVSPVQVESVPELPRPFCHDPACLSPGSIGEAWRHLQGRQGSRGCIPGSPWVSGLVSRGSKGLRSPFESRRAPLGAHFVA